jgi:hypothetical protein
VTAWRPVPGYEGLYEVSDAGKVRNARASQGRPAGYELTPQANSRTGCAVVRLYGPDGGKNHGVARLVARAFHGEPPAGAKVKRSNGDLADNSAANLTWTVTR